MDKIKTIKIKNEDGSVSEETYTISVDAKNVDMNNGKDLQDIIGTINVDIDGNISRQLKYLNENVNNLNIDIKKKAYFFNTVADMKNADLKIGDYACTLGYYEINDGGAGDYQIISGNYTDDGGSYHKLKNNLYAELIIKNTINVAQFGAKCDGIIDDTNYINKAIKFLCIQGSGILKGLVNKTSFINGTIYFCDNITYDFEHYTLNGNGTNILIESGYYNTTTGEVERNYDPNETYTGSYFPRNRILNSKLLGVKLKNCKIGIKAFVLNSRTVISGCYFDKTITDYSVDIAYSWAMKFTKNSIRRTAYFHDFADWTLIANNSFEGSYGDDEILLKIGHGSFSARIQSNGFHHSNTAIELVNEINNTEICNNHFEGNEYCIKQVGGTARIRNIYIHNNWFLVSDKNGYGIWAEGIAGGRIEFNYFYEIDGTFIKKIYLKGANACGTVITAYESEISSEMPDGYELGEGVTLKLCGGRNDNDGHPQREYYSGNYTVEKYIAKYNNRPNKIPMCTKTYTNDGHICTINTFVDYSSLYGVMQPILFYFQNTPSDTRRTILSGMIVGKTLTILTNEQYTAAGEPVETSSVSISLDSNENNKLTIICDAGNQRLAQLSGWIKEL